MNELAPPTERSIIHATATAHTHHTTLVLPRLHTASPSLSYPVRISNSSSTIIESIVTIIAAAPSPIAESVSGRLPHDVKSFVSSTRRSESEFARKSIHEKHTRIKVFIRRSITIGADFVFTPSFAHSFSRVGYVSSPTIL